MQRNILKMILICGVALLLASTPINSLYAAEDAIETNINLDESVSGTYYVNTERGLKMRSAPSTDADVVALLPYKAELTVTGAATDNWYKVEYSNQSGYVAADYLTKSSASNTDNEAGNTKIIETPESTLSPEASSDDTANTFGAAPIITALIAAIIIMIVLAIYTAYSFLKKGNDGGDEEYDDEYIDANDEYDDEYEDDEDDDDEDDDENE